MKSLLSLIFIICFINLNAQTPATNTNDTTKTTFYNRGDFFDKSLNKDVIRLLPYIDVNKISLLNSSGYFQGNSYYYQGFTTEEYFGRIDGMPVMDISNFPLNAMEKYSIYNEAAPIRYGNSLSGFADVVSINATDSIHTDINIITSFVNNGGLSLNQRCMYFSFSGPLSFRHSIAKDKNSTPSFLIAGNINLFHDPSTSAIKSAQVNQETQSSLEANPLQPSGTGFGCYPNTAYVENQNFTSSALRLNADKNSFSPYVKFNFPFNNVINFTVGSFINYINGRLYDYQNAMFNAEQNPDQMVSSFENYARFELKLVNDKNFKINATAQLNYSNYFRKIHSHLHKDNFFNYGYVGKFKTYKIKSYELGSDTILGYNNVWVQNGFRDTLYSFESSDINPLLSNYNTQYYEMYPLSSGYYSNSVLVQDGGGLMNGQMPNPSYGLWNAAGYQDDIYQVNKGSSLMPEVFVNIDYKKSHHFLMGFEYNKQSYSQYALHPVGLWTLMRQLTNKQIQQLDYLHPHAVYDNNGIFQDTVWYDRICDWSLQSYFDMNLRQKLSLAKNGLDWIDIDNLDPSVFSLDMFSADELFHYGNTYVDYYGYDHTGKLLNEKSSPLDFYSAIDKTGKYSRTINAFTPVYSAAYAQYEYSNKRFNIQLGLRVDRYDANQPVLKDKYSLFELRTAGDIVQLNGFPVNHPANIGDNYAVYINDLLYGNGVVGYRNGDTWYNANGIEIPDPSVLETPEGIAPCLVDPFHKYIKEVAFKDYEPSIHYLPRVNLDFMISKSTQGFANYQSFTQNPYNINIFKPQQYLFWGNVNTIFNNPDLKPARISKLKAGVKQIFFQCFQAELSFNRQEMEDAFVTKFIKDAYPESYYTYVNYDHLYIRQSLDLSLILKNFTHNDFNAGINLSYLLSNNLKGIADTVMFYNPDFVMNNFIQYSFRNWQSKKHILITHSLAISLVNHYRTGTHYFKNNYSEEIATVPSFCYFDFKIEKGFKFRGRYYVSLNVAIQNLLNRQNFFNAYPATGKPDDDGYLTAPEYQAAINAQLDPQAYRDQYSIFMKDPSNYYTPRMVQFGCNFIF